eukprot:TRINITY_DN5592_c0_g1_i2.p1 TRINITY_DN5592_c0_g1~~TRINITY_DN5592_c0_g1_i2.p1  ORF type:complete len:705 (+),score=115.56 TRINITY_DN5592_c0_g1_i2:261-2375(+)
MTPFISVATGVMVVIVVMLLSCNDGIALSQQNEVVISCDGGQGGGHLDGGSDSCIGHGHNHENVKSQEDAKKIPRLVMATAATTLDHTGLDRLVRTCGYYGVNVSVIGVTETYKNNYAKTKWFRKFVRGFHAAIPPGTPIEDEPYIMLTDGYDVICNNGPESVHEMMTTVYKDTKVVFSTEMVQYPPNKTLVDAYNHLLKESTDPYAKITPFKYLNAGGLIGKPSHLVECLFPVEPVVSLNDDMNHFCDQGYAAQAFFHEDRYKSCDMVFDYGQRIFGTTAGNWLGFQESSVPQWVLRHKEYLAECGKGTTTRRTLMTLPQGGPTSDDYLCSEHGGESHVNRSTSIEKWHEVSHIAMGLARTRPFHVHGPGTIPKFMLEQANNFLEANEGWNPKRQAERALAIERDGVQQTYMRQYLENYRRDSKPTDRIPTDKVNHPFSEGICISIVDVKYDPWKEEMQAGYEIDPADERSIEEMMEALNAQNLDGITRLSIIIVTHRQELYRKVLQYLHNGQLTNGRIFDINTVTDQKDAIDHCVNTAKRMAYVKVDSVSVLENPNTIQWLLSRRLPMVAPLLNVKAHLGAEGEFRTNFFFNDTRSYNTVPHEYRYAAGEERITQSDWRHVWAVRVVLHTYILRGDALTKLGSKTRWESCTVEGFEHKDSIRKYKTKKFDYEISRRVHESVKESLYLDNTIDFGHLTSQGYD